VGEAGGGDEEVPSAFLPAPGQDAERLGAAPGARRRRCDAQEQEQGLPLPEAQEEPPHLRVARVRRGGGEGESGGPVCAERWVGEKRGAGERDQGRSIQPWGETKKNGPLLTKKSSECIMFQKQPNT
jgi:hypothetical protein